MIWKFPAELMVVLGSGFPLLVQFTVSPVVLKTVSRLMEFPEQKEMVLFAPRLGLV
jgi:hypothetical protein